MSTVAILGLLTAAALLALTVKTQRPEMGILITILTSVMVLGVLFQKLKPLLETAESLFSDLPLSWEYGSILLKGLGICLLTQAAADCCRDAGETALASKAELSGKITLLALSVPLFEKVISLAISMIDNEGIG